MLQGFIIPLGLGASREQRDGMFFMTTFLLTADIVLPGLVLWLAAWLFYPRKDSGDACT